MLPTLNGRIQSRIFLLATIGAFGPSSWPRCCRRASTARDVPWKYRLQDGYVALLWVAVFGVLWECVYHFLMQWRWEKDWPTFFGLVTLVNEGIGVRARQRRAPRLRRPGRAVRPWPHRPVLVLLAAFLVVWLAVWLGERADARAVHPLAVLRRKADMNHPGSCAAANA